MAKKLTHTHIGIIASVICALALGIIMLSPKGGFGTIFVSIIDLLIFVIAPGACIIVSGSFIAHYMLDFSEEPPPTLGKTTCRAILITLAVWVSSVILYSFCFAVVGSILSGGFMPAGFLVMLMLTLYVTITNFSLLAAFAIYWCACYFAGR